MKGIKIIFEGYSFANAKDISVFFANKCGERGILLEGPSFPIEKPKVMAEVECTFHFVEHKIEFPFHSSDALQYSFLEEMERRAKSAEKASEIISGAINNVVSLGDIHKNTVKKNHFSDWDSFVANATAVVKANESKNKKRVSIVDVGAKKYVAIDPENIWKEERLQCINEAIQFALKNGHEIPEGYISERNDLVEYLRKVNKQNNILSELNGK